MTFDHQNAFSVARNIFWVGFREEGNRLKGNPYPIVDREGAVLSCGIDLLKDEL